MLDTHGRSRCGERVPKIMTSTTARSAYRLSLQYSAQANSRHSGSVLSSGLQNMLSVWKKKRSKRKPARSSRAVFITERSNSPSDGRRERETTCDNPCLRDLKRL